MGKDQSEKLKSYPVTRFIVSQCLNDFSGSPRVLADFCGAEKIKSHKLTILTSSSNGFLDNNLGEKKTIWHPRGRSKVLNIFSFGVVQFQLIFKMSLLITRSLRRGEKVIVVNNTILSLGSMLVSRLFGVVNVAYIHEVGVGPPILRSLFRAIAERVIKITADEVVFVSQYLADDYNFDKNNVTVIPNGLRSDFAPAVSLDLRSKFESKIILFIGYLKRNKGVCELLAIAENMPDTPFYAVLNCSTAALEDFRSKVVVPENLQLVASHSDLQQLYKDAFLVLNLSLPEVCVESFALTVLEGMSRGCPVVVPEVGGHFEYFDSSAGISLDARDVSSIAKFIRRLQSDYDLWVSYSSHASKIAAEYSAVAYRRRVNDFLSRYDCG